jgi:hypothetical protein
MTRLKVTQAATPAAAAVAAGAPPPASPSAAPVPQDIPLPRWNDYSAVLTYITSLVGIAVGLITAFQPGFKEPQAVQAVVPAVAFLVATAAQIFNAVSHRRAHAAVAVAAVSQGGKVTSA